MKARILVCCALFAGLLGACAPPTPYKWGNYEQSLYDYYKDPETVEALVKAIEASIADAEKTKQVPPGLYAEYGYLLMARNENKTAITYFNKEKTAWPESTGLMDRMIKVADGNDRRRARR